MKYSILMLLCIFLNAPLRLCSTREMPSLTNLCKAETLLRIDYSNLDNLPGDLLNELGPLIAERDSTENRNNFNSKMIRMADDELYCAFVLHSNKELSCDSTARKKPLSFPSLKNIIQAQILLSGNYSKINRLTQDLKDEIMPFIADRDTQVIENAIAHTMPNSLLRALCSSSRTDIGKKLAEYINELHRPEALYLQMKKIFPNSEHDASQSLHDFYLLSHIYKDNDPDTKIEDSRRFNHQKITLQAIASRIIPFCAYAGNASAIRYLVQHFKGNIDAIGDDMSPLPVKGHSALTFAVSKTPNPDFIVAKAALEQGASLYVPDGKFYKNPIVWATVNGYDKMVRLLLQHEDDKQLSTPDFDGNKDCLRRALEYLMKAPCSSQHNCRIGARDKIISTSDLRVIGQLALKACLNKPRPLWFSELALASFVGDNKIVDMILQKYRYPESIQPIPEASKALKYALRTNNLPVVNKLLQRGVLATPFIEKKERYERYTIDAQRLLKKQELIERVANIGNKK